jgi:TatD DNase family protein
MVQPPLAVDTHCHLFLIEGDTAEVVREARREGVDQMVCVGIDPETSRRSLEMAESFRGVFATAGVHPHTASQFDPLAESVVEELLAHPLVVGVGETGLDYYRRLSSPEDQHRAFRTHIALSRDTGKPLVVHVREAWEDALRILAEERAERVVLHCFSGDLDAVREATARGYFISFAGNLTYPNADRLRTAAAAVADDRLLAETDSPFLTPQSKRGEANRPINVLEVLAVLAEVRGVNVERMVGSSTQTALNVFPLVR